MEAHATRYHTGMSGKTVAYVCECGKKWVFEKDGRDSAVQCKCGRSIVVKRDAVYSTKGK